MTLLIAASLLGCGGTGGAETAQTSTPRLTSVEWVLTWDESPLEPDETEGWATTNDLGYRIEVVQGWSISYLLSLVPCETEAITDTGMLAWLSWIVGAPAIADHAPFSDPSLLELSAIEDIDRPRSLKLGPLAFPEQTYCSVYWLVARGDRDTEAEGTSLKLSGVWSRGEQSGVLEIDTDFSLALIADIPPVASHKTHAQVTLTRPLARLFDGIDFAESNGYKQSWQALSNLVEGTEITAN